MSTKSHEAAPRINVKLGGKHSDQHIVMPKPLDLEPPGKGSWMRFLPIIIIVVMVGGMVAWMAYNASSGRGMFSPYMMFMPLMMIAGFGYYFVGGSSGGNKLHQGRMDFFIALREQRKLAHIHGASIHELQASTYPHPETLLSRIGSDTMWQIRRPDKKPDVKPEDKDKPRALKPWLSARCGSGLQMLYPKIDDGEQTVGEKQEPVTSGAYRRFRRTQQFVVNCPQGLSLIEQRAYAFKGNQKAILGLARAMIVSLAFNHSPNDLTIGVVCDDFAAWDWVKWLPHTQNRMRRDVSGTARFAWRSLRDAAADLDTKVDGKHPHMVIFVDTPRAAVAAWPNNLDRDVTIVVLRAKRETLTTVNGRMHVSTLRELSTSEQKNVAYTDWISTSDARLIAQSMSRYRPPNWGSNIHEVVDAAEQTVLDVFGIKDIDTYDPRPTWAANENDSNFVIPLGFAGDSKLLGANSTDKPGKVITINMGEASVDGTGPHGCIQGLTGFGKSYLLRVFVLALCLKYSPTKVNIIVADFKVGTFSWFDKLPHIVTHIRNLEARDQSELIERTTAVLDGEIKIRERWLDEYDCEDIVEYRAKRVQDPDTYPPWPELFIFVDEFHQYMEAHKEDLKLLVRTGAVGRALGMHIIPSSQFIDSALLQDLMEHLTFGISLKTRDASRSRTVLKKGCEAAKDLVKAGDAILSRYTQDDLSHFVGFNFNEPYIAPQPVLSTQDVVTHDVSSTLRRFALANDDTPMSITPNGAARKDVDGVVAVGSKQYPMLKNAVINRLAQFNDVVAVPLWQPTLRAPITYADIKIHRAATNRLEFRIGDIDAPYDHKRLPYVLTPEGSQAHIAIIGHQQSGRSTAVQAIIAASAQAHPASHSAFYIIDYGAKLAEISSMPNVGGYARNVDTEKIDRLIGEFIRVAHVRNREFAACDVSSLDDYFEHRRAHPITDDPYGHMFLVIDGLTGYLSDHEADDAKDKLFWLTTEGTKFGLHVIVTTESLNRIKPMLMQSNFGTQIQLALDWKELAATVFPRPEVKDVVRRIPADQPGRCVDIRSALHARIVVPQSEPILPIGESGGNPVYDRHANYKDGVKRFCGVLLQQTPELQRAVRIEPAPALIDHSYVWQVYSNWLAELKDKQEQGVLPKPPADQRAAVSIHMPIGVSTKDLRVVTIPDAISPNLLALGDKRSGKTSLLRGLINSIVLQFRAPSVTHTVDGELDTRPEALIAIIESHYDLLAEQEQLAQRGYLLAYGDNKKTVPEAVQKIRDTISPRIPTSDTVLSAKVIKNRTWYDGPEVFVLIDGVRIYSATSFTASPLDPLIELINERNDLGLHVYATGPAQGFASFRTGDKMYKALSETNTSTLLFSGPVAEGTLWPSTGIKFATRRSGQAALVDPETMAPEVIQTPYARPWDDDA